MNELLALRQVCAGYGNAVVIRPDARVRAVCLGESVDE